ncbi:MAG: hypothetical protein IPL28_07870 [Chloroflexi bacterium]|nr:hypothetical protein [Chloroflexota bacterium]
MPNTPLLGTIAKIPNLPFTPHFPHELSTFSFQLPAWVDDFLPTSTPSTPRPRRGCNWPLRWPSKTLPTARAGHLARPCFTWKQANSSPPA